MSTIKVERHRLLLSFPTGCMESIVGGWQHLLRYLVFLRAALYISCGDGGGHEARSSWCLAEANTRQTELQTIVVFLAQRG